VLSQRLKAPIHIMLVFTEVLASKTSFRFAVEGIKFILIALLLMISNPVEIHMFYETSKMQMGFAGYVSVCV
jgi:hypothetical protein